MAWRDNRLRYTRSSNFRNQSIGEGSREAPHFFFDSWPVFSARLSLVTFLEAFREPVKRENAVKKVNDRSQISLLTEIAEINAYSVLKILDIF